MSKTNLSSTVAIVVMLLLGIACKPAQGDDSTDADEGVRHYQRRDYAKAAAYFDRALRGSMNQTQAYYAALTYQQTNQLEKSEGLYRALVQKYPSSSVGKLAAQALKNLEQSVDNAPGSLLPKETWVPFNRMGTHLLVQAEIDHKPVNMIFDTGAESCLFTAAQFRALGMPVPSGPPTTYAGGVGEAKPTPIWRVKVDLTLGKIERKNFPVGVSPVNQPMCLLGQDFYRGYTYTIDDSNQSILFKRVATAGGSNSASSAPLTAKGSVTVNAAGNYVYSVPYRIFGRSILVNAEVNGKPCEMIFDTGAGVCFFTFGQLRKLGIDIDSLPSVNSSVMGIGGNAAAKMFHLREIKLGPVQGTEVETAVSDRAMAPYPLLGQSFFRAYEFTIDSNAKVIRFSKK